MQSFLVGLDRYVFEVCLAQPVEWTKGGIFADVARPRCGRRSHGRARQTKRCGTCHGPRFHIGRQHGIAAASQTVVPVCLSTVHLVSGWDKEGCTVASGTRGGVDGAISGVFAVLFAPAKDRGPADSDGAMKTRLSRGHGQGSCSVDELPFEAAGQSRVVSGPTPLPPLPSRFSCHGRLRQLASASLFMFLLSWMQIPQKARGQADVLVQHC